jgi:hypothetical protein
MKTPEELAYDYGEKFDGVEISKNDINIAWYEGYKAAQKQGTNNAENVTLKDILGMTIEEYLHKHSEEIAEEVLNNNPLLKELKDE